ncbi:MAG: hypothetical protein KDA97_12490, partial [Acidimicrobiales bacterium]|nr:hypothetical protein [Acidimicrobiales bacterium]
MTFPDGFWWGVGASDRAERGPAPASDRRAADAGPTPDPATPIDPATLLGVGHRRFTVEWARVEP